MLGIQVRVKRSGAVMTVCKAKGNGEYILKQTIPFLGEFFLRAKSTDFEPLYLIEHPLYASGKISDVPNL